MGKFKELKVWKLSMDLVKEVYRLTNSGTFSRDFGLKDQIRRAAVSVPSNIAEGDQLNTQKQSIHYFHIAKGSMAEVQTQLIIAKELGYISSSDLEKLEDDCLKISSMIMKLIQFRSK